MKISCGILIKNEFDEILMGHVTGQKFFDIPKGGVDDGEDYLGCALRECEEETSLKFIASDIKELGLFDYNKEKKLYLFQTNVIKSNINFDALICTSMFEHPYSKKLVPELDGFKWVEIANVREFCAKSMGLLLSSIYTGNIQKNKI